MSQFELHLVGSIPLRDSAEVFSVVGGMLGPKLARIPDGETGPRLRWLGWLEPVFANNAAFESTKRKGQMSAQSGAYNKYRISKGVTPTDIQLTGMPVADEALKSFAVFRTAKESGDIPSSTRFQVAIASPISVARAYFDDSHVPAVEAAYEKALLQDVSRIVREIPNEELAIQWDIASPIFLSLEVGEPTIYGETKPAMFDTFAEKISRLGNHVPLSVELLLHFCYGDANHRHAVEPTDMGDMVELANRVAQQTKRSIQLIHMPVPRNRADDAYFKPLRNLTTPDSTTICLGLIHLTDGAEGTRRRLATAERYLKHFIIATECGFGRRPPETTRALLNLHAELAGLK